MERIFYHKSWVNSLKFYPSPIGDNAKLDHNGNVIKNLVFCIKDAFTYFYGYNDFVQYKVQDGDWLVFGFINDYMTINRIGHQILQVFSKGEFEQKFEILHHKEFQDTDYTQSRYKNTDDMCVCNKTDSYMFKHWKCYYDTNGNKSVDLARNEFTEKSIDFNISWS